MQYICQLIHRKSLVVPIGTANRTSYTALKNLMENKYPRPHPSRHFTLIHWQHGHALYEVMSPSSQLSGLTNLPPSELLKAVPAICDEQATLNRPRVDQVHLVQQQQVHHQCGAQLGVGLYQLPMLPYKFQNPAIFQSTREGRPR